MDQGAQPSIFAGLKVLNGETAGHVLYPLQTETMIGRVKSAGLFVPDLRASRKHCQIQWRGRYVVIDMSSNGTWLNGNRLERSAETPLNTGDTIRIGSTEIEFRLAGQPVPAQSAPPAQAPAPGAPIPAPGPAAAAPPVDYVFDFDDDDDGGEVKPTSSGLSGIFSDKDIWSSQQTQKFKALTPEDMRDPLDP